MTFCRSSLSVTFFGSSYGLWYLCIFRGDWNFWLLMFATNIMRWMHPISLTNVESIWPIAICHDQCVYKMLHSDLKFYHHLTCYLSGHGRTVVGVLRFIHRDQERSYVHFTWLRELAALAFLASLITLHGFLMEGYQTGKRFDTILYLYLLVVKFQITFNSNLTHDVLVVGPCTPM